MTRASRPFFSLHELLIMAALAALGGVSSAALSVVRAAVHAMVGLPGGMQFMAGIHVLWLVLAVGLIRKPGAATITGLLKGAVELLSGNPLGLLVVLYSGLAGVCVDLAWVFLQGRHRRITYMLAGGLGTASNVLVLKLAGSLPSHKGVVVTLMLMSGVAFASGVVLAGLLGWWLLRVLRQAGAVGAQGQEEGWWTGRRTWVALVVLVVVVVMGAASMGRKARARSGDEGDAKAPVAAPRDRMSPG